VITGAHTLIYTEKPEELRSFFRDILGLPSVDAGDGWLIFALPPAELGVHPGVGPPRHELQLMCDDVEATVAALRAKGVEFVRPVTEQGWGFETALRLPDGGELSLYQPKHALPPRD
jgi:catechol 2,3-dioxygenase-like lactoylglutathione lyase family enzyme